MHIHTHTHTHTHTHMHIHTHTHTHTHANMHIHIHPDPNSHSSIPSLLLLTLVVSFRARNGFYFVWNLAESINNCAGLGFRGHSADGQPLWDLISVADPFEVELSTSMRSFVNAWNKPTVMWVRRCVCLFVCVYLCVCICVCACGVS